MAAEGFAYSAPTIELEVYGVAFSIEVGDVALVEAVDAATAKVMGLGDESRWADVSECLRGAIRAVMGADRFDEAFGGRPANVIAEIECLAYIRRRIREGLEGADALSEAVKRLLSEE